MWSGWRGRWEGGSGWGTHVNPWLFHSNVWQNSLQKLKKKNSVRANKKKKKIKQPSWKNGQNNWTVISPKRKCRWPTGTWKGAQHHQLEMPKNFTTVKMATIKKNTNNKCRQGYGEKGTLYTVGGNVIGAATVEYRTEVSQETKNRTTIWPSNFTPDVYISPQYPVIWKDICTPKFIAALFTITLIWKELKCPSTNEWIKMWDIYIYIYTHTHTHIYIHTHTHTHIYSFPHSLVSKESACSAEDSGSIPRLGRYSGEGNGHPLQYSCLENPIDRGA